MRSVTFSLNGYGSFSHRRLALLLLVLVVAVLGNYGGGSRRLMLLFFIEMTLDLADAAALESHTHRHPHQRLWSGNSGQPPQKRQLANRPQLLDSASNLLGVDELDQSPGDGGLRGKKFALDAADVCAHTACGDDEAVADGDPNQLSVVERRELLEQSNRVLHHLIILLQLIACH